MQKKRKLHAKICLHAAWGFRINKV
jgi:hypothetical protein